MNNRRIVLTILIGAIALGSASATLAWYGASNKLLIEAVEITIDGERELKISTSDNIESFKDELTYEELNKVGAFIPVSSMFKDAWVSQKSNKPLFYDASHYSLDAHGVPIPWESSYGYFSQDVYILADDDVYVTIDPMQSFMRPNSLFNNAYADNNADEENSREDIILKLNELVKAMRFSILVSDDDFYSYTVINPNNLTDDVLFGGALDNNNASHGYFDYYQVGNDLQEVVYGDIKDRSLLKYNEAANEDSDYVKEGESSAFNARHKKGVKSFDLEESIDQIAIEDRVTFDEINVDREKFYFPVYRDTPRKITLSIYIEGWDLASINSTMGASFESKLAFEIYREIP